MEIIIAWLLDRVLGDPSKLPHPIVLFGKTIAYCDKRFNKGKDKIVKGAVVAISLIVLTFVISSLIITYSYSTSPFLGNVISIILIFFSLSGKTLAKEVKLVFDKLKISTEEGRKQIARIVGRDTSNLSPKEIKTAALETLAENLSDGVIAPMFWYLILGVPGMLAYKMVNTLDSMIAYKTPKYIDFGRYAAKIDDYANYIPARLTTMIMIMVAPKYINRNGVKVKTRDRKKLYDFVQEYGSQHTSPNSGYPESALAGILDCQFGGSHNYFGKVFYKPHIGKNPREIDYDDMITSLEECLNTEIFMVAVVAIMKLSFNIVRYL